MPTPEETPPAQKPPTTDTGSDLESYLKNTTSSLGIPESKAPSLSSASQLPTEPAPTAQMPAAPAAVPAKPLWKQWKTWAAVAVGVVALGLLGFVIWNNIQSSREKARFLRTGSGEYDITSEPLKQIAESSPAPFITVVDGGSQFTVNGQFNLNGRAVIASVDRPTAPVAGELWYQKNDNKLYFYDGTQYIDISYASSVNGAIQAAVRSVQGQTGNVTLTAGAGIAVAGTTISNSGVISLETSSSLITVTDAGNGKYIIGDASGGAGSINLQVSTPGVAQSGNANITGTFIAGQFQGGGAGITNLNASNIATGTLADARLSTNVTLQGNTFNGASQLVQLNGASELPALNGINLTNLNASNIATGTLADARLSTNVTLQGNTFNGASQLVQLNGTGGLPAVDGSAVTNLNASNVSSGTLADARLSTNVALLNANQVFSGNNTFTGTLTAGTITSTGSLTIGNTAQALLLQGSSSSSFTAHSGANTTTVGFTGAPTGDLVYNFDMATTPGTYTICTTIGNCASSGGGVTTLGGTTNKLAKFTGSQSIGDSSISDTGASVTIVPTANTTSTFNVQNTSNADIFLVDTSNGRVAIGQSSASYDLDVSGDINATNALRVAGNLVCDSNGCEASGGSGFYIQNGISTQSNANFNVQSNNAGNVVGVVKGAASQTADLFQAQDSSSAVLAKITAAGNFDITGNYYINGSQIASTNLSDSANLARLNATQTFTGNNTFTGTILMQNASNSTTAVQIQNAAGTSNLFIADTTNTRIGIGKAPGYTLDVNGDVNIAAGSLFRIGGTPICGQVTATCAPSSGSTYYIQNGTSVQSNANFNIQSANAGSIVAVLRGASGQTANLFEVQTSTPSTVFSISNTGVVGISTLGTANTATYLCRNSSNQVATCSGSASGTAFIQGGNSFGATGVLGTNDSNSLFFRTGGTDYLGLDTSGLLQGSAGVTTISMPGSGANSERFGLSATTGSGTSATALGNSATANAQATLALGASASATNVSATALGYQASASGVYALTIGPLSTSAYTASIALGASTTTTADNQWAVGGGFFPIYDAYFGRGVANSSPTTFTLHATGGAGTNIAGASLQLAGGQGTGTGAGGSIVLQTAPAGSSGSSANALTTYYTLNSAGLLQGSNGATISVPGSGTGSERFGAGATTGTGQYNTAVGNSATTSSLGSATALGYGANASGSGTVAIGYNATASSYLSIAGVSVGYTANAGIGSVSLGATTNASGVGSIALAFGATATTNYAIALGYQATTTASNQFVAGGTGSPINDVYFGKGVSDITPTAYTIHGTSGLGTNIAGANLQLAAGQGTGSAAGGSILFQTSSSGSSGTSLNALTTRFTLNSSGLLQGSNGATLSVPGTFSLSERFGASASATNTGALAVGASASASGQYGIALGYSTSAYGTSGIAIGGFAGATSTSIALGYSSDAAHANSITIGYNADSTATNQLVVGSSSSSITNAFFGSGVVAASPAAFTLNATGGFGTNNAGANLQLAGGRGTGSAAGGSILFQTAAAGSSGTAQNSLVTYFTLNSSGLLQGSNSASISAPGSGGNSERFGAGASTSSNTNATAIGASSSAGANGVALGTSASAGSSAVAIGAFVNASGNNSVSIGGNAFAASSTTLGYSAAAYGASTGSTALGYGTQITNGNTYSIALGYGSTTNASNQLVVGSTTGAITNGYFGNGVINASPSAFTLNATGGSGTNIAGANLRLAGGRGTGNATGGDINLQVAAAGSSGSSLNSLSTVATIYGYDGSALFKNAADSTTGFSIQDSSSNPVFVADTTNNRVGIGTNGPLATLDVVTASDTTVRVKSADNSASNIKFLEYADGSGDYGGVVEYDGANNNFRIGTMEGTGVYAINITKGAEDVGIGDLANSTYRLQVTDTSADTPARFTGASGSCIVDTSGGGWTCVSDQRLKTNITAINTGDALGIINQLEGVTFNWLNNPDGQKVDGFIAQAVQQVLPELVTTNADGNLTLNKIGILPYAVAAIQEQQKQIQSLQAQQANANQFVMPTDATFANLNVSGNASLASLTVTGSASVGANLTVGGNLTVAGTIITQILKVNGKIIGNPDTRGKLTIQAGATDAQYTFTVPYDEVPNIVATPTGNPGSQYWVSDITKTGFKVNLANAPVGDIEFNFQAQQ